MELEVFSYNDRALRCYEGLGFTREGVRREARYHDGTYHDALQMSILATEWNAGLRARFRKYMADRTAAPVQPSGGIRNGG